MSLRRIVSTGFKLALVAGFLFGAYAYLYLMPVSTEEGDQLEPEVPPVARVAVAPIEEGSIDVTVTAYGTVEAALGGMRMFSVPYECRVSRVMVMQGQTVMPGDPLVEIEPSPETRFRLDQARQERDAARKRLALINQRQELHLTTGQEVLQAEQAAAAAELRLQALLDRGIEGKRVLAATSGGVVNGLEVQPGRIVASGDPLLGVVDKERLTVRLGMESEDAFRLHDGRTVRIERVDGLPETFDGRIVKITREVDPETRLVNVFVTPKTGARLLLNEYVRGVVRIESRSGLVVPCKAVLPKDNAHWLYTVENNRAVLHKVEIGPIDKGRILVSAEGLQAGRQVVTTGNTQLEDGMAVKIGGAR